MSKYCAWNDFTYFWNFWFYKNGAKYENKKKSESQMKNEINLLVLMKNLLNDTEGYGSVI